MSNVVKTSGLTKCYKGKKVVNDVSVTIGRGDIYGFIGENGAGKTTFMKMLVGLVKPTYGQIQLFGGQEIAKARRKVGCVIECPCLFEDFSAYDNLKIYNQSFGIGETEKNICEIMSMLHLSKSETKAVKNYSLGMRQRVAISIALLGNPELLILDEPINGLDPEGIQVLRQLLLELNSEKNITILISSHILGELSKISTKYGVLHQGRLVKEFKMDEFEKERQKYVHIRADNIQMIESVISHKMPGMKYRASGYELNIYGDNIEAKNIMRILYENRVQVDEITNVGIDLEKYVFELMRGGN
nr:ATP-binding cassette domain-containing protein [uncultured Blautia sp.]